METRDEFFSRWVSEKPWHNTFIEIAAVVLAVGGAALAFDDEFSRLSAPFLLAGIACVLWKISDCAEGIHFELSYLRLSLQGSEDEES